MTLNGSDTSEVFDAIVIGGGPAGATCAYMLSTQGHSVLLLEKKRFPRFHIGESMIAYITKIFEMLGILEKIENGSFVYKRGVEISFSNGKSVRVDFKDLAEGQKPFAFNLERARFDEILLELSYDAGVRVLQESEVKSFIVDSDQIVGVEYEHQEHKHKVRARFVVDASGRAGLISKHFKFRKMNPKLQNVAVFQHFENLVEENNPSVEGDFCIAIHEDGWIWGMPIKSDTLSVGAVMPANILRGSDPRKIFDTHCSRAPRIKSRLEGATPVFEKPRIESDFCYHSERLAGPGYFIVGDAGCFVDPLFSGGVLLSMVCGMKAAEVINNIFKGKDEEEARTYFENFCKTGYDSYFRLVYAFYQDYDKDLISMFTSLPGGFYFAWQTLNGDYWGRPDQPVLSYLRSQRKWDTFKEPFELVCSCPIYPDICYKIGKE